LNIPSGNVQDIKYLYTVIACLKSRGGRSEINNKTFEYFKKMLNDYNEAKAAKYGLSFKPRDVNVKVVKHIVAELNYLRLTRKENGYLELTEEGQKIASLIEDKDSIKLKQVFVKLMIENFKVFEYFLKHIKEKSNGNGVPIPFITAEIFDKYSGDLEKLGLHYSNIVNKNRLLITINFDKLYDSVRVARIESLGKRTDKIKKLQAVIERFVVSEVFGPNIQSRRVYDFVRSRTTFLELTNYSIFNFDGLPAEVTYLISYFEPMFKEMERIDFSRGTIYLNSPTFQEIQGLFKEHITKIYNTYKDDFGYMKIADMRDRTCKELKISDRIFDDYLKKLSQEDPNWLSFTYSGAGDKITEKRLPIIFEKPIREFYTLLKINPRR